MTTKQTTKTKSVLVPEVNYSEVQIPIRGLTTLLTNQIADIAMRNIEAKGKKTVKEVDDRSDEERCQDALYEVDVAAPENEGRYGMPGGAFRKAMVSVCRNKDASGGINMSQARQMFQIMDDIVPIYCRQMRMRVDKGRNKLTGLVRIIRPEFVEWTATLNIRYNADVVSADQIVNLVQMSGSDVGVGCWRPECSGNRGMFSVVTGK